MKKTTRPIGKTAPAKSEPRPKVAQARETREEKVRRRAHELYQHRVSRGLPGDAISDWLQAEKEVR